MVDGRIWFEAKKAGEREPREYTPEQAQATRDWAAGMAAKLGWTKGA